MATHKAIHGMFCEKLRKDLEDEGFVINPHDPCTAHKNARGKQLAIAWHVDNLKVSHMGTKAVDEFAAWVEKMHGDPKMGKVKAVCWKRHKCQGIVLDCTESGMVKVHMTKLINTVPVKFPEQITKTALTLVSENLFNINQSMTQ